MPLDLAIVGAGLSGLALGSKISLSQPGLRFSILEAKSRPGGIVGTSSIDGYRVEAGPNGFLDNNPSTITLARDLGLGDRLIPASEGSRKNRFVFWNGAVQAFPRSLREILTTPLLPVSARLRLLCEPLVPRPRAASRNYSPDESIAAMLGRRVGPGAARVFADAFVTGIFGGDYRALEAAACLPRVVTMERERGSLFAGFNAASRLRKEAARERGEEPQPTRMWSFPNGLQELVDAMTAAVGERLRLSTPVQSISRDGDLWRVMLGTGERVEARRIALCCPPAVSAELLRRISPDISTELAAIRSNRIAVVALGFDRAAVTEPRDGFGFLVPQALGAGVLGVQWCSEIFPGRAPEGKVLWRALAGGWTRGDLLDRPDAEIIDEVLGELRDMGEVRGKPEMAKVIRWDPAIPQYLRGHSARLARIERLIGEFPGLSLLGNGLRGVAMNDIVAEAGREADAMSHQPASVGA